MIDLRKYSAFSAVALGMFASSPGVADDRWSVGVGAGALYSGIGVNLAMRRDHAFGYLAAGCGASYTSSEGWNFPCGVGAGWIWTDILTQANDRHGLGIYVGPVSVDVQPGHDKVNYGAGLTYVYFFQDAVAKGWNLGITPAVGKKYGDHDWRLLINVGYQF